MPPRLARLLAVLAAVALVAGALVLRSALAGEDGGSDDDGPGSGPPEGGYQVLCDADLGDGACDAVAALDDVAEVAVMAADEAVAALTEGAAQPWDAWVALDPWPDMLDVARAEAALAPSTGTERVAVASSTPALLTRAGGGTACDDPATWACLADEAAAGLDVGMPTLRSATGPLVLGLAATGLEGTAAFGIGDVLGGPVEEQLADLLDSADPGTLAEQAERAPLPGVYQAIATIEGLAGPTVETSQGQQQGLVALPLAPEATLGVVLAPLGPDGPGALDRLRDQVTDQTVTDGLAEAGWSGDAARTDRLPEPDLLYRLDEEFTR